MVTTTSDLQEKLNYYSDNKSVSKVQRHEKEAKYLTTLYEKKNNDYGDSFGRSFQEYGMIMPCIRLEDKLNRLKSLTVHNKKPLVEDESIRDTLVDIANYAIMTIIELDIQNEK